MSDLVVLLPGIIGSTLLQHGRPVWAQSPGAALRAVLHFGRWAERLTLPEDLGDDAAPDGVVPGRLMSDLHLLPGLWTPLSGYDRLVRRLRTLGFAEGGDGVGNLVLFPYDWRLSNRYTARRLAAVVEPALERWRARGGPDAEARLVFVAHSMGGLVARQYVEREGGAELTRKIVTLGTPHRGAARALGQLVNGAPTLLGPLGPPLTRFARSLPSVHQLLPEYACVDTGDGELLRVTEVDLPGLSTRRVADAVAFHTGIHDAASVRGSDREALHSIVGVRQPTATTVRLRHARVDLLETYRDGEVSVNDYGDATVPRVGGTPRGLPLDSPLLHSVVARHGWLQSTEAALDEVEEAITASPVVRRGQVGAPASVSAPDLVALGDSVTVEVVVDSDHRDRLQVRTTAQSASGAGGRSGRGTILDARSTPLRDGRAAVTIPGLPPGVHVVEVTSAREWMAAVTATVVVWPRDLGKSDV